MIFSQKTKYVVIEFMHIFSFYFIRIYVVRGSVITFLGPRQLKIRNYALCQPRGIYFNDPKKKKITWLKIIFYIEYFFLKSSIWEVD